MIGELKGMFEGQVSFTKLQKNYFILLLKLIEYLIDHEKGGSCLAEEVEGLFPHCLPAGSGWQTFIWSLSGY